MVVVVVGGEVVVVVVVLVVVVVHAVTVSSTWVDQPEYRESVSLSDLTSNT